MSGNKHILLMAFPGYGHLIPLLELAKKISAHHKVTFAISNSHLNDIRKRGLISGKEEEKILLCGIDDGVPDGVREDSPYPGIWAHMESHILPAITQLVESLNPDSHQADQSLFSPAKMHVDLVITDIFFALAARACKKRNIPCYLFCSSSAGPFRLFLHITENNPVTETKPDLTVWAKTDPAEREKIAVTVLWKKLCLNVNQNVEFASGFIVSSFRAIEEAAIKELQEDPRIRHREIFCVGPLIPHDAGGSGAAHENATQRVVKWLDKREDGSVIYISFGSVEVPSEQRIQEIGKALVKIKRPFIFSLRETQHGLLPVELQEGIATQFTDLSNQGLVLTWAPQKIILSHPATKIFMSHCGWNSTLEAIWFGKPVVGWPLFGDQIHNSRWLQEIGMGLSLINAGQDVCRFVDADEIERTISKCAGWDGLADSSGSFVNAARNWSEKAGDATSATGSSTQEFLRLVEFGG